MSDTTNAVARFHSLLSPEGRQLLDKLAQENLAPDNELKIGQELRKTFPVELVLDALTQHQLRLKAKEKFPRAMEMFFTKSALEQASSEVIAKHRSIRFINCSNVADLCCGIGGDLLQLAQVSSVTGVDKDLLHLEMARTNAQVLGVAKNTCFIESDVRGVKLEQFSGIFIDPSRRTSEGRLKAGDSEPPIDWCIELLSQIQNIGIKLAPGIDHKLFPPNWELEFISLGKDLKEAAAWSPALATTNRRATIMPHGHTLVSEPGEPVSVDAPGQYLLDPNPAVTRAGLVEELARQVNAWKIDNKIAFLSSNKSFDTPFGRNLKIIDSAPWHQKELAKRLKAHDIGIVDIRRRGLAGDIDQLQRSLKLTGSRQATLVMTRVQEKPWALICLS